MKAQDLTTTGRYIQVTMARRGALYFKRMVNPRFASMVDGRGNYATIPIHDLMPYSEWELLQATGGEAL